MSVVFYQYVNGFLGGFDSFCLFDNVEIKSSWTRNDMFVLFSEVPAINPHN